jgi:hypothetical protein
MRHDWHANDIRPSRWPRPLDDVERMRALALAHLDELERQIAAGVDRDRLLEAVGDAIAKFQRD